MAAAAAAAAVSGADRLEGAVAAGGTGSGQLVVLVGSKAGEVLAASAVALAA